MRYSSSGGSSRRPGRTRRSQRLCCCWLGWCGSTSSRLNPACDYRIPYPLSGDYWLYQWRLEQIRPSSVPVLGDSVIWGEYVRPDGTLTHFLNRESGQPDRFVNIGVNGVFPLAMEGLIREY